MIRDALARGIADAIAVRRWLVLAWLANLALALPLAGALFIALRDDLGQEIAAERLRVGWDDHWHRAFAAQAEGIERTFDAGIVGIGAVLRAIDAQIAARVLDLPMPVLFAAFAYAAMWVFLSGGFVGRFLDEGAGFWRTAGESFGRLAALTLVVAGGHALLLGPVRSFFIDVVAVWTRDTIDERVQFLWVLGRTTLVWSLVWVLALVHDYARVRIVADRRCSVARSLVGAVGFLRTNPGSVMALSLAVLALGVACLLAYWPIAPGASASNPFLLLMAFAISQLSVLARIFVRAVGWASQVALVRQTEGPRPGAA